MGSKQIMFFALLEDIKPLLLEIESTIEISYYLAGLQTDLEIATIHGIDELSNIGFVSFGDWNKIDRYLVQKKVETLNRRAVLQKDGATKFAVDQMINPKSIELKVGGVYLAEEKVIIAGRVATISNDMDSNILFKLFASKIKKSFRVIDSFYVGPFAEVRLKTGWRLVVNTKLSRDFDLKVQ